MSNDIELAEIRVGDAVISFEIPKNLFNMISSYAKSEDLKLYSYNAETIINILRGFVPDDVRPPTHRQESYARKIAKDLKIELPNEVLLSVRSCSDFLEQHAENHQQLQERKKEFRDRNKALISQANRVNRWMTAFELLHSGMSPDDVAKEFGVKLPTIEKYLVQLREWRDFAEEDNSFESVIALVERQRNGEDIYELYDEPLSTNT
ncbi:hypothetical protein [uncultured Shewanella sp.]|uniref:hypothetical protein n=1 Tax=uncultured Shewanella sp. TaxID=173975 RepID=UPI00262B2E67|nr:hypothetical protein [uncultured Shewanella sp.]